MGQIYQHYHKLPFKIRYPPANHCQTSSHCISRHTISFSILTLFYVNYEQILRWKKLNCRVTIGCFYRETDLEEVLALQTKLHNSAGMFLDSARRSVTAPRHHTSSTTTATTSRPRTPTASPHGSPRRGRKSPSMHGEEHCSWYSHASLYVASVRPFGIPYVNGKSQYTSVCRE